MSKEALDCFGENLMSYGRDLAIREWDRVLDGTAKGVTARAAAKKLSGITGKQMEAIRWLIPHIVDTTLDYVLWWLEQEKSVEVLVKVGSQSPTDVAKESDGLPAELYTERGWIRRFSFPWSPSSRLLRYFTCRC